LEPMNPRGYPRSYMVMALPSGISRIIFVAA
jgi:hypothetical protein